MSAVELLATCRFVLSELACCWWVLLMFVEEFSSPAPPLVALMVPDDDAVSAEWGIPDDFALL